MTKAEPTQFAQQQVPPFAATGRSPYLLGLPALAPWFVRPWWLLLLIVVGYAALGYVGLGVFRWFDWRNIPRNYLFAVGTLFSALHQLLSLQNVLLMVVLIGGMERQLVPLARVQGARRALWLWLTGHALVIFPALALAQLVVSAIYYYCNPEILAQIARAGVARSAFTFSNVHSAAWSALQVALVFSLIGAYVQLTAKGNALYQVLRFNLMMALFTMATSFLFTPLYRWTGMDRLLATQTQSNSALAAAGIGIVWIPMYLGAAYLFYRLCLRALERRIEPGPNLQHVTRDAEL